MPLYEYRCAACGKVTEVRHGFDEPYDDKCPHCGGELQRVFSAAPVVFKGSGFYATDSRKKSDDSSKSSETKASDAKPAETKSSDAKPESSSGDSPKPSSAA